MIEIKYSIDQSSYRNALRQLEMDVMRKTELAANTIGAETVAFLRSKTSEMRPPAFANGPMRPAHPGHWADVTGALALAYAYTVIVIEGQGVRLVLDNSMEYADYLERRHGYWVLSEVTEAGGPVEAALIRLSEILGFDVRR